MLILFAFPIRAPACAMFALAFLWSAGVQFVGANSGAAGAEWNAVPVSIDRAPQRLWQMRDNQIVRNMRAVYHKDVAWKLTLSAAYRQGLTARVISVSPLPQRVPKDAQFKLFAIVRNDGRSRQYGYDTGVYVGQLRIRVRISDVAGRAESEQSLYVDGAPAHGEWATATGDIRMPSIPGIYRVDLEPFALGLGPIAVPSATKFELEVTLRKEIRELGFKHDGSSLQGS